MKKNITFSFFLAVLSFVVCCYAADDTNVPDWIKRLDYSVNVETDKKPTIYFETVQPLSRLDELVDHVIFAQPRVSIQDERGKYSIGAGIRRLFMSDTVIGGANIFGDYQQLHEHHRAGFGLEALGKFAEARANYYVGTSTKRMVEETATTTTYEKAVDGFDIEGGSMLPYLPWVKLFGSYYWYDYKKFDDREGWKIRTELKPSKFLTIDAYIDDDNKGDIDYGATTAMKIPFEGFDIAGICRGLLPRQEPFLDYDLRKRFLDPVERSFDIEVEKWQESGTIIVEIGRS